MRKMAAGIAIGREQRRRFLIRQDGKQNTEALRTRSKRMVVDINLPFRRRQVLLRMPSLFRRSYASRIQRETMTDFSRIRFLRKSLPIYDNFMKKLKLPRNLILIFNIGKLRLLSKISMRWHPFLRSPVRSWIQLLVCFPLDPKQLLAERTKIDHYYDLPYRYPSISLWGNHV